MNNPVIPTNDDQPEWTRPPMTRVEYNIKYDTDKGEQDMVPYTQLNGFGRGCLFCRKHSRHSWAQHDNQIRVEIGERRKREATTTPQVRTIDLPQGYEPIPATVEDVALAVRQICTGDDGKFNPHLFATFCAKVFNYETR